MEKYYIMFLKYLSLQTEIVNVSTIQIDGIRDDFILTITNELFEKDLVSTGLGGWVWINEKGKGYLIKNELDISQDISNVQIVHNIIGNNTFNQSFNDNLINSPINTPTSKDKKYPIIKWILGIIGAIIAALFVWWITKP